MSDDDSVMMVTVEDAPSYRDERFKVVVGRLMESSDVVYTDDLEVDLG